MRRKSAANIGTGLPKISPGQNDSYISGWRFVRGVFMVLVTEAVRSSETSV
jgi:hypothetical protein